MIKRLDHINFITDDMDKTLNFYINIIGLVSGKRLNSATTGMEYLYLPNQEIAILHMGNSHISNNSNRFKLTANNSNHTGRIDHFCLACNYKSYDNVIKKFTNLNVEFETYVTPDKTLKQIWIFDPNNIRVELNFSRDEI